MKCELVCNEGDGLIRVSDVPPGVLTVGSLIEQHSLSSPPISASSTSAASAVDLLDDRIRPPSWPLINVSHVLRPFGTSRIC